MTIFYLVSAEPEASKGYWKIGITDRKDRNPLNRDRKKYREVFRALELPPGDARSLELIVAQTFGILRDRFKVDDTCGREALPYPFTLAHAEAVLDFWLGVAESSERYVDEDDDRSELDGTGLNEINGDLTAWTVAKEMLWYCASWDEVCPPSDEDEDEAPSCGPDLFWVGQTGDRYTPPEVCEPVKSDYTRRWFSFASVWGNKVQNFLNSFSMESAEPVARPQDMWA